jgi:rRNA processing protein Krr1/Pno1
MSNLCFARTCQAYYEKHGGEIEKYRAAKEYLNAVMNGKSPIPVKEWRKELSDKTAEKHALYDEFYKLWDDVRNVEVLRRNVERIMNGQPPERATPAKEKGMGL